MTEMIAIGLLVLILLHVCVLGMLFLLRRERLGDGLEKLSAGVGQMLYRVDEIRPPLVGGTDPSLLRAEVAEHAAALRGAVSDAIAGPQGDAARQVALMVAPISRDVAELKRTVAEQTEALRGVVSDALNATLPQPKPPKPHPPQFALRSQEKTGRVARDIYVCAHDGCGHLYVNEAPLEGGDG